MPETYFAPAVFRFLGELHAHNERDWFNANKQRYERDVRDPILRFIADIGPRLQKISPHLVADPRPSGGSLFRIYRDTRFSKDKSPYKTHLGAHFFHEKSRPSAGVPVSIFTCSPASRSWPPASGIPIRKR